ncbi:MAG: WD40 repeat domain-containing protein [Planctomycetia bacterium]|nr:WD40 repeat domain-containing protein [Planctomycetia bacterium]
MVAPRPVAVRGDGGRVVVATGCETLVYDLESGDKLHAWADRFSSVQFSADGCFLLAVQRDDVTVWNAETFAEVRRFAAQPPEWNEPNHGSFPTIATVNDDASLVAIASRHGSLHRELPAAVLVYDTRSGELRQTLATPDKTEISSVAFLPGGHRLVVDYSDGRQHRVGEFFYALWAPRTGELVHEFPSGVMIRVSPDGRRIVGGRLARSPIQSSTKPWIDSTDLTAWETDRGTPIWTVEHVAAIRDLVFSPNGEEVLAAVQLKRKDDRQSVFHGRLIEWDARSGEKCFEGDDSPKPYATVAYSPDGQRRFATTEEPNGVDDDVDHRLCGWNVKTGAKLPIADCAFTGYNGREDLYFYPKGDRFIDLAAAFAVRDVLTGATVRTLPDYRATMRDVAFTPNGEMFVAGPCDDSGASYSTDCRSGRQGKLYLRGRGPVFMDGGRMVFTHDNAALYLIDVISNDVAWTLSLDANYQRFDAAISPDAKRVVVSQEIDHGPPSQARVILVETSQPDRPRILERYASAVAFRPDGTRFLAASPGGIDEFDALGGDRIRTLWTPPGRPLCVTYGADGAKVLACGVIGHADRREPIDAKDRGWAMLWDGATNRTVALEGHTGPVTTAAFGPDGARCATGSLDKTIRLWDSASGSALTVLRGHVGGVHRIAYSPRGDRILSTADDGAALWNVARFATPPMEPTPLPESFTLVESAETIRPMLDVSGKPSGTLRPPPPGARPASVPADPRANWIVVKVGKVNRRDPSPEVRHWLSRAKATQHCEAPPTSAEPPSLSSRYSLCGTSRDGRRKVYVSSLDQRVVLCDEECRVLRQWYEPSDLGRAVISPSGKEVAIARGMCAAEGSHWTATVYDATSGLPARVIADTDDRYLSLAAIDPKERTIMLQTSESPIVLLDYQTGKRLGALPRDRGGTPRRAEYSPDGRFVATSKFPDSAVTLCDPISLAVVKTLTNPMPVRWFAFGSDGKYLVVGQSFGAFSDLFTMWEVDSGRRLWSCCGPNSDSANVSPDGRRFVSYGSRVYSCLSTLWDAETGEILCVVLASASAPRNKAVFGHDGASLHLAAPDGPRLWPPD